MRFDQKTLVQTWLDKIEKKITSEAIVKQFILEELEGASQGNEKSKEFVKNSGFDEADYIGSMNTDQSFDEVDGGGGPQQTLIFECQMPLVMQGYISMDESIDIKLKVVDEIMKKYSLGKYSQNNIRLILKDMNSKHYSFLDLYQDILIKESLIYIKLDSKKFYNQQTQSYIRINNNSIVLMLKDGVEKSYEIIKNENLLDEVLIFTEGKTDWKHLKKALNRFQKKGEYLNLNIKFEEYEKTEMGDAELDTMVRAYSKKKQKTKHIFIFDRDNKKIVNKYGKDELNNHGNNVYSLCIPSIIDELDEICIEFYYKENDLTKEDENGKRIFIGKDFLFNGNSKCGQYVTAQRNAKPLDILDRDKQVYLRDDIEWKNNIALSKNDFTNNVINDVEGFNNFDIEYFKLIFDVIEKIVYDE